MRIWLTLFSLLITPPALAVDIYRYDIAIEKLHLGVLRVEHDFAGIDYHIELDFETGGVAKTLFDIELGAKASGEGVKFGRYIPNDVSIAYQINDEHFSREVTYESGQIRDIATSPKMRQIIDPATQPDAIDPVTALAYIFRRQSHKRVCEFSVPVFDGHHVTRLLMGRPTHGEDRRVTCRGAYTRLNGFDEARLEEQGHEFYFSALYRIDYDGNYILDRIIGQSPFGQFELISQY